MVLGALERALESAGLGRRGDQRVLVACSGGRDSVALAHAAVTLLGARRVSLGHVDHRVRPGSEADARVVEGLGQVLGARVRVEALPPGPSSEARLRALRYQALERLRAEEGATLVLLGHTADDQAETVLFGLIRTTRAQALWGMPARRGYLLRPLLAVPRAEVHAYTAAHHLPFVDDPSNAEARYLRSRLRKELLPLIEARYRPGFKRRLAQLAASLGPRPTRPAFTGDGPPPWLNGWKDMGFSVTVERVPRPTTIPDGQAMVAFDADLLGAPTLRCARPGDRIRPFGFDGHRKLKDLYREAGIPPPLREALPVVEANGEVVWVPGVARAHVAPISETTREVWVLSIRPAPLLPGAQSRVTLGSGEGPQQGPEVDDQ